MRVVPVLVGATALVLWWLAGPVVVLVLLAALCVPRVRALLRPGRREVLGAVLAAVALVAVVLVVPAGRLPVLPGAGRLVTPAYVGRPVLAAPLDVPGRAGPTGLSPRVETAAWGADTCGSGVAAGAGRLVVLCQRTGVRLLDGATGRPVAERALPGRDGCAAVVATDLGRDRILVGSPDGQVLDLAGDDLALQHSTDLGGRLGRDGCLVGLVTDDTGRTWWASRTGRVGVLDATLEGPGGRRGRIDVGGRIGRAPAVAPGARPGAYVLSDRALVRVELGDAGTPRVRWRASYDAGTQVKPGQGVQGSGAPPLVLPGGLVAMTDNADQRMHVQLRSPGDGSLVCQAAVLDVDESATSAPLVAVGPASVVVAGTYGRTGPLSSVLGRTPPGGLARVDADGGTCTVAWTSDLVAPSGALAVSAPTGQVLAWTARSSRWGVTGWYVTALDARTGRTAWAVRVGTGVLLDGRGPLVVGPGRAVLATTLGGWVRVRDGR